MSTAPFGAAGFGFPPFDPGHWERLARQWFTPATPAAARPAAVDPFAWWRPAEPAAQGAFDPGELASQWMTRIQQLAAQFAGREAGPAEIARAWRAMLGDNPFGAGAAASAFMPMSFFGAPGRGPFEMPAFGYAREHQERLQAFARAGADFQQAAQAFQSLLADVGQEAFSRFESLLAGRMGEGKPLENSRALLDLWIDAAEDAYADMALGERFQRAFGDYVNAQMRLRAAMQKEVELACAQWGIPGRAEVDAAHRKVAGLERELRRLRDRLDALERRGGTGPAPSPAPDDAAAPTGPARAKAAKSTGKKR
ncbi:MAG: class III poly(R)-hydroxyalkanoic acid synthase subunit PhaE [Pseudomonadota bacterium]